MKSKIFLSLIFSTLLLCGCTDNNTDITVSSENNSSETVSTEETVSSVTEEETTSSTSTTTISDRINEDPFFDHRTYSYDIECDFIQFCTDKSEIYADDGTLIGPITVEYPQIYTENEEINNKINSKYKEYMDDVMQCHTPFYVTVEDIYETYERGIKFNIIDGVNSELTYLDDKYISFRDYHSLMGESAAHPAHAYTAHTFSLETGDLLTLDDIFNENFIHFAKKYIVHDLNELSYRYGESLYFSPVKDNVAYKLKNNEWYLTPDGFTLIFAHDELTSYALGTFSSTIPWELIEEYMK